MTPVPLDIFIDPVCPWCHVGKAGLDRALAEAGVNPFAIRWHPFRLNADLPREGVARRAWLLAKFGDPTRLAAIHERLREAAQKAGLALDPDLPARLPDTLDAHRLIHWAGVEGRQDAIVAALFRAYWHEGRDIGDPSTLADIAGENGMDRAATRRLLAGDADSDDLLARIEDARRKGVSSVPTFLVAGRHVVTGAQPPELWAGVIAELRGRA